MTRQTVEKFNQEIFNLKREMGMLRSFLIGALIKDSEGEYKPEFVRKILRLSRKKGRFIFKNAKSFLEQVQKSS